MIDPEISVVIPTFNSAQYLPAAIQSVIDQDYVGLEIIVVDDGSIDDTENVVNQFSGVNYLYQDNAGAAAARNAGVQAARGGLIAFLDADDLWMPEKLVRQLSVLRDQPDVDMVFGHVQEFYSPDIGAPATAELREYVAGCVPGTLLIKTESLLQVGQLSTQWKLGEFLDWYMRAQEIGLKKVVLKDVLLKRRIHSANMGVRKRDCQSEYVAVIKSALDRRRQLSSAVDSNFPLPSGSRD